MESKKTFEADPEGPTRSASSTGTLGASTPRASTKKARDQARNPSILKASQEPLFHRLLLTLGEEHENEMRTLRAEVKALRAQLLGQKKVATIARRSARIPTAQRVQFRTSEIADHYSIQEGSITHGSDGCSSNAGEEETNSARYSPRVGKIESFAMKQPSLQEPVRCSVDGDLAEFDHRLSGSSTEPEIKMIFSLSGNDLVRSTRCTEASTLSGRLSEFRGVEEDEDDFGERCRCGSLFMHDAVFCRRCGAPRASDGGASRTVSQTGSCHSRCSKDSFSPYEARNCWTQKSTALSLRYTRRRMMKSVVAKDLEPVMQQIHASEGWFRHLMLHPGSTKRFAWDFAGIFIISFDMVMIPMTVFDIPDTVVIEALSWATLLFWTADMGVMFISGYINQKGAVVMIPRRVVLSYLRSWFALDFIVLLTDWTIVIMGGGKLTGGGSGKVTTIGKTFRMVRFIRTVKLLRLFKLTRVVREIESHINSESLSIYFKVIKIIIFLVALNHVVACIWFGIGSFVRDKHLDGNNWIQANNLGERELGYQYTTSMHWSLTQFTPASMEVRPYNVYERLFSIVVLLFAMVSFSSFVSILTSSITQLQNMGNDESKQFWLLRRYLVDSRISKQLGSRIQRYLEYVYAQNRQVVQEKDVCILSMLSGPLRQELRYAAFAPTLSLHSFFSHIGDQGPVCHQAVSINSIARGDTVFSAMEPAEHMYFVIAGELQYNSDAVCLEDELPIHLGKQLSMAENDSDDSVYDADMLKHGDWIAEAVLWTKWVYLGDLISLSIAKVTAVDAAVFGKEMEKCPPAYIHARHYAKVFCTKLSEVPRLALTDRAHRHFKVEQVMEDARISSTGLASVGGVSLKRGSIAHIGVRARKLSAWLYS